MIHSELYFSIYFEEEGRGTIFFKSTQENSAKNVVTAQGFCLAVAFK